MTSGPSRAGFLVTDEGADELGGLITQAQLDPARFFYRVVRSGTTIVGPVRQACGHRESGTHGYLEEAKGSGVADRFLAEFLVGAGESPMRLWVSIGNERAVRFYQRHGFEISQERDLWKGRLLNALMVRPAQATRDASPGHGASNGRPS